MRKLFLLIPAMLLAITAGAKEITITPGTANILRTTVNGCTDASNVITLSDNGEYTFDNTEQYIAISTTPPSKPQTELILLLSQ